MKHQMFAQHQNHNPTVASRSAAVASRRQLEIVPAPSADDVARRVYFTCGKEGSVPGHELQDWLEAEVQLLAERN